MNKLTIIGNLTGDPQTHQTQDGRNVCNFTVAVNRRRKVQGQPEADFFRVDAWGKTAENCQQYLSKGRKVAVVGPVSVSTYQANDGSTRASLELHADDVEFLSSAGGGNAQAAEAAPAPEAEPQGNFVQVETDELPF